MRRGPEPVLSPELTVSSLGFGTILCDPNPQGSTPVQPSNRATTVLIHTIATPAAQPLYSFSDRASHTQQASSTSKTMSAALNIVLLFLQFAGWGCALAGLAILTNNCSQV